MVTRTTIVIADGHPVTRAGLISILHSTSDLRVIGEASDGVQTLDMCRELHPDLLLLDTHLAKIEGLMIAHLLSDAPNSPRIMLFSATSNSVIVQVALDTGVSGYVLKNVSGKDLLDAIYRVLRGQKVLVGIEKPRIPINSPLSIQELEVLRYVADGFSTKEIASLMSNSTRTIETYINRVFSKLGANNRPQAVSIAHRKQLLPFQRG